MEKSKLGWSPTANAAAQRTPEHAITMAIDLGAALVKVDPHFFYDLKASRVQAS